MTSKLRSSAKASSFAESVIREMTRIAQEHDAINLGQGFPDFPAPQELKDAAARAIAEDHNQYPITWGVPIFRDAIAAEYARAYGMDVDPATEICVTCGSTEAVMAAFLGLLDDGDEVVLFEPFYESYGPDSILAGASRRYVTLRPPDWSFDPDELRAAFGPATRVIVVNSPHNPTGKVFSREELGLIAELCVEHDAIAVTDEIYEHITYDGHEHVPIATLPGMRERTVTVGALSKTYSVTGWRVGWAIADARLMGGIRATHDFMTVGAATPLAARRRRGPRSGPGVPRRDAGRLRGPARADDAGAGRGGARGDRTRGRVLRDGRRLTARLHRRHGGRDAPGPRGGRRGRAGLVLLLAPGPRHAPVEVRVLQAPGDARGGGPTAVPDRAMTSPTKDGRRALRRAVPVIVLAASMGAISPQPAMSSCVAPAVSVTEDGPFASGDTIHVHGIAWTPDCNDSGSACGLMLAGNRPASGVSLTLSPVHASGSSTVVAPGIDVTSDLDFTFEVVLPDVPPGRYAIGASSDDTGTAVTETFRITR